MHLTLELLQGLSGVVLQGKYPIHTGPSILDDVEVHAFARPILHHCLPFSLQPRRATLVHRVAVLYKHPRTNTVPIEDGLRSLVQVWQHVIHVLLPSHPTLQLALSPTLRGALPPVLRYLPDIFKGLLTFSQNCSMCCVKGDTRRRLYSIRERFGRGGLIKLSHLNVWV